MLSDALTTAGPAAPAEATPKALQRATAALSLQQALFGWHVACANGPLGGDGVFTLRASAAFKGMSDGQEGAITSLLITGAFIGTFVPSLAAASALGRRKLLLLNNGAFVAGGVGCALAGGPASLALARLVAGLAVGVASVVCPLLVTEIAPAAQRGRLAALLPVAMAVGMLGSGLASLALQGRPDGWRAVMGWLPTLLAAANAALCADMVPESPSWLARRGLSEEAVAVLKSLRPAGHDSDAEAAALAAEHEEATAASGPGLLTSAKRPLAIGVMLGVLQKLTGSDVLITFYSTTILQDAGFARTSTLLGTAVLQAWLAAMTYAGARAMDTSGRRSLLLWGTMAQAVALLAVGIVGMDHEITSGEGGVSLLMLLLYIAGFASGLGAVLSALIPEIFEAQHRSRGVSLSFAANWLTNLALSQWTFSLIDLFEGSAARADPKEPKRQGVSALFLAFAATSAFAYWCVLLAAKPLLCCSSLAASLAATLRRLHAICLV